MNKLGRYFRVFCAELSQRTCCCATRQLLLSCRQIVACSRCSQCLYLTVLWVPPSKQSSNGAQSPRRQLVWEKVKPPASAEVGWYGMSQQAVVCCSPLQAELPASSTEKGLMKHRLGELMVGSPKVSASEPGLACIQGLPVSLTAGQEVRSLW